MIITFLRKNIGTIIAFFGFILLTILTFGDIAEVLTEDYWLNVRNNLTSIGYMTLALTVLQVVIKQGIGEQALQRGLNTPNATTKYAAHKELINESQERMVYLPYFLQIHNDRATKFRRREFLINNGFSSEKSLYASGRKRLIRKYEKIHTHITTNSIKWATTTIKYDKEGKIETLETHRVKRAISGTISALFSILAVVFIADGLFFQASEQPIWQKFVRLLSYVISIGIGSILSVVSEYEKGAFGVPNELDEINEIWREFKAWVIPEWVIKEVEKDNAPKEVDLEREESSISRGHLQEEQTQSQKSENDNTSRILGTSAIDPHFLFPNDTKFSGQCHRDNASA